MNKRDIKVLLESYYLKSLCSYNDDFYPIMVVEAVKSIIGINLDKNSNNILLWLENYMLEIEVYDYQYFPLIHSLSNLDFNPSYNSLDGTLKLIPMPYANLLFHSVFIKIFGYSGFILLELICIFLFL